MDEDRRVHPRLQAAYKYQASCMGREFSGLCRNVSAYGMAIYSNEELEPESDIELKIFVPDVKVTVQARGEVVYCMENPESPEQSDRYLIGIRFIEGPVENFTVTTTDEH